MGRSPWRTGEAQGGGGGVCTFGQAVQKYASVVAIKPDFHEALSNWGVALADQAKDKGHDEAATLLDQAMEKYSAAFAIKPDKSEVADHLGHPPC